MNTKRVFSNLGNFQNKVLAIYSQNEYLKNKFLTCLSQKIYSTNYFSIFNHNDLRANFVEQILIPELNILITTTETTGDFVLDLDVLNENLYLSNYNNHITSLKNEFALCKTKIENEFLNICELNKENLNKELFNNFMDDILNKTFSNIQKNNTYKEDEFLISSITFNGFKSFSNQLHSCENRVIVLNDSFNLFKDTFLKEFLKQCRTFKLPIELYKNPIDKTQIDHIKIPSLNLFISSRDYLFNNKKPGTQINENKFSNKSISTSQLYNLNSLIKELNFKGNLIENKLLEIENKIDSCLNKEKFNNLIDYAIKNVIQ